MSRYTPDFKPEGILKADPAMIIGYYIIAGILSVGGIAIYFMLLGSVILLMILLGGGAVFALLSFLTSKTVYYWDDEHFAAVQPLMRPAVYRFDEIKQAAVTDSSVSITTDSGKKYIIPCTYSGIEEFKAKLPENAIQYKSKPFNNH